MIPLSVVNPDDLSERFGLDSDVVAYAKFDGDGFDELVYSWNVFGLREGGKVVFVKPISGKL